MNRVLRRLIAEPEALVDLAHRAGAVVSDVYAWGDLEVSFKSDSSPLTLADKLSNETIVAGLKALAPSVPILSEENKLVPYAVRKDWEFFWLVDPLDGTKEFIKRNGEFTVNIALIVRERPVLGVVHAPALDLTYLAAPGAGALRIGKDSRSQIHVVPADKTLRVVGSRSHASPEEARFLARIPAHTCISMGSSLKLCVVAEGAADIYPRFGPTSEWDIAAAHAVLEHAGGALRDLRGEALCYNKPSTRNPHFVAVGDPELVWRPLVDGIPYRTIEAENAEAAV